MSAAQIANLRRVLGSNAAAMPRSPPAELPIQIVPLSWSSSPPMRSSLNLDWLAQIPSVLGCGRTMMSCHSSLRLDSAAAARLIRPRFSVEPVRLGRSEYW